MLLRDVVLEAGRLHEGLAAHEAHVPLVVQVGHDVGLQVLLPPERLVAVLALVRPDRGVLEGVVRQLGGDREPHVANGTGVVPLVHVVRFLVLGHLKGFGILSFWAVGLSVYKKGFVPNAEARSL